jgi:hypothetical protein
VLRLEGGTVATIVNTTFENNEVSSGKPETVAAGPVAGLKDDLAGNAAAIWFQGCKFGKSTKAVAGEVSVDTRACRVYSNTRDEAANVFSPQVWDLQLSRVLNPWLLAPADGPGGDNVFGNIQFPHEGDAAFSRLSAAEAEATNSPRYQTIPLPSGTSFITQDPYAGLDDDDGFWTDRNIGLVVGLGGAFILLAAAVLIWYFFYFRADEDEEETPVRPCSASPVSRRVNLCPVAPCCPLLPRLRPFCCTLRRQPDVRGGGAGRQEARAATAEHRGGQRGAGDACVSVRRQRVWQPDGRHGRVAVRHAERVRGCRGAVALRH